MFSIGPQYYAGDGATGLAVDGAGSAYVTGYTYSSDFPVTVGAFQTENKAFHYDGALCPEIAGSNAFVTKLNATGAALVYSTYLGGSIDGLSYGNAGDSASALTVDGSGGAYITGQAYSTDFPVTEGAFQTTNHAAANFFFDTFVTKLNSAGTALAYSTYLGGSGTSGGGDSATGLAVDSAGNAYITGSTFSTDFPVTQDAFQATNNGAANSAPNAFVTKLNPAGTALVYSSYMGGSGTFEYVGAANQLMSYGDAANGLAVDAAGDAYVAGFASSSDFPATPGAFQPTNRSTNKGSNAFVAKMEMGASPALTFSPGNLSFSLVPGVSSSQTINLTSSVVGLTWTASASASWVSLSPTSGTTPGAITVGVNTASLQPGDYTAIIAILNTQPSPPVEQIVSVSLTVPASVSVAAAVLYFNALPGASAQSQSIQIGGVAGASWQATTTTAAGGAWLIVSPAAGQVPASLTAVVDSGGLTVGTYQGTITVHALVGGFSRTTSVTLTVASGQGGTITTVAGNGYGSDGGGFSGDGGAAISAELKLPYGVAVDTSGNFFIADSNNNRIRKVSANGIITTVAGNGIAGFAGDGGLATLASLSYPFGVAVDASGNLFIADSNNHLIRKVLTSGIITTVAGGGTVGLGDGGPATSAIVADPLGIAVDAAGNLFIAEWEDNRIRKVSTSGIITTVAGGGTGGLGDGGPATSAKLSGPGSVAVDTFGNLFIADSGNNRIRKVSTGGIIMTVAGGGTGGLGDGGSAISAELDDPGGVAVDTSGNLFIADGGNNRVRKVSASGTITTVAGDGTQGLSGDGGPATSAALNNPTRVAMDVSGNLFIADEGNNRIREVSASSETSGSIQVTSVGNGASFAQSFSPGMLMSVFGIGLSTGSPQKVTTAPLPVTSLSGTLVTINGISAPLLYISATQINLQIPYEVSPGAAVLTVNAGGESGSINFTIQAAAPGIFVDSQNGHIVPNESATTGSTIGLYLTGAGQATPSEATGNVPIAGTTPVPILPVTLMVGGAPVTPAYMGIPAWSVGVLQINFTVPSTLTAGTQPVVVTIGGAASNAALLTVTTP